MKKCLGLMVWVITVILLAIPAIAHDTQEVTINEGALYTVTRGVSLALAYTGLPAPTQMRFRNEGEEWPEWEPYDSTKQWVLSEKDGVKTVYVETRYWAKVGWSTLSDNSSITFDTTPPVISAVLSVEPNTNGWNNTDVVVTFQATDVLSGVASISGDTAVTTEGKNQSVTGQAVDKAGNVATFVVAGISIDKMAPIVTGTRYPEANVNGWNNTDVAVTFQATDALSGVASISGDTTVTTEGENQSVMGQAVDKAGNVATFVVAGISIDKTVPVITGMRSPDANVNGWNNTDVAVTFQATDALSGVASISGDATVTTEGENQSVTGQAMDKAGNVAAFVVTGISIDKTAPIVTGLCSPEANLNGWNNTDVAVTFQATDALSGVASTGGDTTVSTEGANQSVTGQAVDEAGNVATFVVAGISIDKTVPVVTGMRSPEPNANGWNNTNVAVTFQATDALSGVASISGDTAVTTEGKKQSVMGQAVDKAGNVALLSVVVNLDKTPPNVSSHAHPGADAMVWNNTDVAVAFETTDDLSGVDSVTGDTTITTEGENQSVIGKAVDKAGNVASATLTNMNIDRTLPALTVQVSGTAREPAGEPLDVLALLSSFDGFTRDDPIFAVGTKFSNEDGSIITDALVTLEILEILASPEPGGVSRRIAWFTTCTYSSVSQEYYALFPAASLSDGVYELWFTTNTRQSVRSRIVLKTTP